MRAGAKGFSESVGNLRRFPQDEIVAVDHIGCQLEIEDDSPVLNCALRSSGRVFGFYGREFDNVFVSGSAIVDSRLGRIGEEGVFSFEYEFSSPVLCRVEVSGGGEESAFVSTVLRCEPRRAAEAEGIPRRPPGEFARLETRPTGGPLIGPREHKSMAFWEAAFKDYAAKMREDRRVSSG